MQSTIGARRWGPTRGLSTLDPINPASAASRMVLVRDYQPWCALSTPWFTPMVPSGRIVAGPVTLKFNRPLGIPRLDLWVEGLGTIRPDGTTKGGFESSILYITMYEFGSLGGSHSC